jgi:hypothetical protein
MLTHTHKEKTAGWLRFFCFAAVFLVVRLQAAAWFLNAAAAKQEAHEHNRPLLVAVTNADCDNCVYAWNNVLNTSQFLNFAESEQLVLLYYNLGVYGTTAGNYLYNTYSDGAWPRIYSYPYFLLFHVQADANLQNHSLDANNVAGVAAWGHSYTDNVKDLTCAWLCDKIAGCFPNNYWTQLSPLPSVPCTTIELPQGADDLPTSIINGQESFSNAAWVWRRNSDLNGSERERYFLFNGQPGQRFIFFGTGLPADDSREITCAVFANLAGTVYPAGEALRSRRSVGFDILDRGFYYDVMQEGQYLLRISRSDSQEATGLSFTLRAMSTAAPTDHNQGHIYNPHWTGCHPGEWTMDLASVQASGQAYIMFFTSLSWCPYCTGLEKMALESEEFNTAVSSFPLVVLDNRRRGEITGPSLLYTESYQTAHQLTDADAEMKLADNYAWQQRLCLPGETRITYPTLLLCRPDGSIVGRTPSYLGWPKGQHFPDIVAGDIRELASLEADIWEELDNQVSQTASRLTLAAGQTQSLPALIGGTIDVCDWRVVEFTGPGDWRFCFQALENAAFSADANIALEIYDCLGHDKWDGNLLARATGSGAELPVLEYRVREPRVCRLKITCSGQEFPEPYQLLADGQQDFPPYDVSFEQETFPALANAGQAQISLHWQQLEDSQEPARIVLRTAPGTWTDFTGSAQEVTIAPDDLSPLIVNIPLPAGAQEPYYNCRTFTVTLEETVNCRCVGPATVSVMVFSRPAFMHPAEQGTLALTMLQGLPLQDLQLPLANGLGGITAVEFLSGELPPGVVLELLHEDTGYPQLRFSGTPQQPGTYNATLRASANGFQGSILELTCTVAAIASVNAYYANTDFAGGLYAGDALRGSFLLHRGEAGALRAEVSFGGYSGLEFTAGQWSAGAEGRLLATLTGGSMQQYSLQLNLAPDGRGSGRLSSTAGEVNLRTEFSPLPWSANNPVSPYAGYFTVALTSQHSRFQGSGEMRIQIVEAEGRVNFEGTAPDGTVFSGQTALLLENGAGIFSMYAPLKAGESGLPGPFIGGRIQVIGERNRASYSAPVNDAGDGLALYWCPDGEEASSRLETVGTVFLTTLTFSEQVGADAQNTSAVFQLTFTDSEADGCGALLLPQLLPQGVNFWEGPEGQFIFSPALCPDLSLNLAYDRDSGLVHGSATLFTAALNPVPVILSGILTPIPESCCAIMPQPAGQGRFFLNNAEGQSCSFAFSIQVRSAAEHPYIAPPVPEDCGFGAGIYAPLAFPAEVEIDSDVESAVIIWQENGGLLAGQTPAARPLIAAFPGRGRYSAAAVQGGCRSAMVSIKMLEPGNISFIRRDNPGGQEVFISNWQVGWNLLAIPDGHFPLQASGAALVQQWSVFALDQQAKAFVRAKNFAPGKAYWLFVPEWENLQQEVTLPVAVDRQPPVAGWTGWRFGSLPLSVPEGYTCSALWLWSGAAYQLSDSLPELSGAWQLYRP